MTKFLKFHFLSLKRRILFNYSKWLFSFIGAFTGIALVYLIHQWLDYLTHYDLVMLIGSFGASAAIIFGTPNSPYAFPRHAIGGHLISAMIGLIVYRCMLHYDVLWLSCALAVAISVVAMQLTKTSHPPGGATALIAIIGTNKVHSLGFWFILSPVLTGILILLGTSVFLKLFFKHHQTKS